jgi:DNA anti-recombination protein RmuC
VGLLLFGQSQARPRVAPRAPTGLVALLQRVKNWFRGEF